MLIHSSIGSPATLDLLFVAMNSAMSLRNVLASQPSPMPKAMLWKRQDPSSGCETSTPSTMFAGDPGVSVQEVLHVSEPSSSCLPESKLPGVALAEKSLLVSMCRALCEPFFMLFLSVEDWISGGGNVTDVELCCWSFDGRPKGRATSITFDVLEDCLGQGQQKVDGLPEVLEGALPILPDLRLSCEFRLSCELRLCCEVCGEGTPDCTCVACFELIVAGTFASDSGDPEDDPS